ncbi:MAG: hypothetical protein WBQ14_03930 [Gaiellaceae bacterium]
MKKHLSKKRVALAAIVVVALAIASGVAYAYWTGGGSGTATASVAAGTPDTISVTQDGAPSGLYPGGPALPIEFTITNTLGYDQTINSVAVSFGSPAISGGDGSDCTSSDFLLENQPVTLGDVTGVIPEGGSVHFTTGTADVILPTIKMVETGVNQNDCKNATVNLKFSAINADK